MIPKHGDARYQKSIPRVPWYLVWFNVQGPPLSPGENYIGPSMKSVRAADPLDTG